MGEIVDVSYQSLGWMVDVSSDRAVLCYRSLFQSLLMSCSQAEKKAVCVFLDHLLAASKKKTWDLLTQALTAREVLRVLTRLFEKVVVPLKFQKFLFLLARRRRLRLLPILLKNMDGETEKIFLALPAVPLKKEVNAYQNFFKDTLGTRVDLEIRVDESLVHGYVLGHRGRMLDTSLKRKFQNLRMRALNRL